MDLRDVYVRGEERPSVFAADRVDAMSESAFEILRRVFPRFLDEGEARGHRDHQLGCYTEHEEDRHFSNLRNSERGVMPCLLTFGFRAYFLM